MSNIIDISYSVPEVEQYFKAKFKASDNDLRANVTIHDKQYIPIICKENPTEIIPAYWGIPIGIDFSSKQTKATYCHNIRIEDLRQHKSIKNIADNICIIPVVGFYYFQFKFLFDKEVSMLHRITYNNQKVFGLVGVYGDYLSENKTLVRAFTLLTTKANEVLSKVNNKNDIDPRMPVCCIVEIKDQIFRSNVKDLELFHPDLQAENLEPEKDQPTLF